MTTRLILVSHALTDWNLEGLIQGHTDVPLNRIGHEMARRLALFLAGEPIHAIYTSDLKRAFQTAYPTAKNKRLRINTDIGLREGRSFRQVTSPVYSTLPFSMPVESRAIALNRLDQTLTRIAENHDDQTLLVVTHAGVLELFINSMILSNNWEISHGIRMALNLIEYKAGAWDGLALNRDFFLTSS